MVLAHAGAKEAMETEDICNPDLGITHFITDTIDFPQYRSLKSSNTEVVVRILIQPVESTAP